MGVSLDYSSPSLKNPLKKMEKFYTRRSVGRLLSLYNCSIPCYSRVAFSFLANLIWRFYTKLNQQKNTLCSELMAVRYWYHLAMATNKSAPTIKVRTQSAFNCQIIYCHKVFNYSISLIHF